MKQAATREKIAQLFHALSDETRVDLIERLDGRLPLPVSLLSLLTPSHFLLSFHLKVLKDAGLIRDRREGRWMYYSIDRGGLDELEEFVADLKRNAKATRSSASCC